VGRRALTQSPRSLTRGGFTLLEVLVALGIAGIAVSILVTAFGGSYTLFRMNDHRTIALSQAQLQLSTMLREPALFAWPKLDALNAGAKAPVTLKAAAEGKEQRFAPPTLKTRIRHDRDDIDNLFRELSWEAFVEQKNPSDAHVALTVVLHWSDGGNMQSLLLTTAVPKSVLEGQS
jgi:prepilin-type N-terminal cleavage/methylation domain-containing protein